jgi:NitT/TauT family transport system ATP-binding protein
MGAGRTTRGSRRGTGPSQRAGTATASAISECRAPLRSGSERPTGDRATIAPAATTAGFIRVARLGKSFRALDGARPGVGGVGAHLRALDDVSFEVGAREVVAVVGPNGCGKSTLLRLIGGLLTPDEGTVDLGGEPVAGPDPRVGFVFQEPRLLPWASVSDNVGFPLRLADRPAAERDARVADLLDLVDLAGFAHARPHQLSGGMRQRAAIARALALEPAVLLLDEPFSSLDAITRERFGLELLRIWERTATTIVLVTHSIPEAVFLADRVLMLSPRPGHVVADIRVTLPRPRAPEQVDSPAGNAAALEVRRWLADGADAAEADRP